jgi:uncharacterized protein
LSFFPKAVKFYDLFRKQNQILNQAAAELDRLFHDQGDMAARCTAINSLEIEGDGLAREIARLLAWTFITPLDREDIHAISVAQEDVLNIIRAISTRVGLYQFKELRNASTTLVRNLKLMLSETVPMFADLQAARAGEVAPMKIKEIKNESETLLVVALGEIYELPLAGPETLLDIIKWSQIYDRIEQALEKAGVLANVIEGISVKNA